ncbi:IS481 family transposase [Candidatus Oleimmundimicrobium sp.]|uniref:IS481 family transposase n=1 Tax=Candidatus Oleimmundimicrobium sp. TaxID=3060597 RepID=UPI0027277C83|nr:IS481 family transposase [Candidatus Oleimmundimicrobium sp.]MDO8886764.1 IS481 family transposase [Candidatus Oleimmundimicrobium sp.]
MKGSYQSSSMSYQYRMPKLPKAISQPLSKEARLRLKWFDFYYSHNKNAELTCRYFGISKRTFYKWKKRYRPYSLENLEDRSKRPKNFRRSKIPLDQIDEVVSLRKKYPAWSKYKLEVILKREHGIDLSASTIGRILKEKNLINPRISQKKKRAQTKVKRLRYSKELKAEVFGDVVQFDSKHFNLPWGEKRYQINAIDVLSKLKFSRTFSRLSSRSAKTFFLEAQNTFPFPIKRVQTDNGSEFMDEFDNLLSKLEIPHYFTYPNCPKQNSIVERSIQTDIKEFYELQNFMPTIEEQNKALNDWNNTYNTLRPHQSLGYLTPKEYYEKHKDGRLKPLKVVYVDNPETVYHVVNQNRCCFLSVNRAIIMKNKFNVYG